jgi:hypothetical protein
VHVWDHAFLNLNFGDTELKWINNIGCFGNNQKPKIENPRMFIGFPFKKYNYLAKFLTGWI